jgi:cytochrome P450
MAATLPPGPRAPRPWQAVLWGLRYPEFTGAAHRRFGSTFTLRAGTMRPYVVTTDGEAVRRLLTGDPASKRHANEAVRPLIGDDGVILVDGEEHLARRRLLLPPFHGERVRGYGEMMERIMEAEVADWRPGAVVETLPVAQNLTIEVILQAVLGVADKAVRDRFRTATDAVFFYPWGNREPGFALGMFTPAVTTYYPHIKARAWWNAGTWAWWRRYDRLIALVDKHIAATKADPRLDERDDVLAMLVAGDHIPDAALREDVLTLIAAGHETTAAAIAWGAVLLAHHPDIQERAADGDEAYLAALTKEILRFRPPLPVAAGRVLDEPVEAGGHTIPAGTPILIDAWGLHHDPARHADPGRFAPERFLGDKAESYSWLPFGGGHRRCIGAALAELEIRVALATMLRAVRLEPAAPELAPTARRGIVVVPKGGGRVRVAVR